MYRKNVASQYIYFTLINTSTGAGLTGATVTAYRALDGGAQASATGTTSELGNGQYRFNLSQADTDANYGSYLFTATGASPVEKTVTFTSADPTDATAFGITRIDAAVSSRMASYTQPTGFLTATFPSTVASTTNITSATGVQLAANQDVRNVSGTISDKTGYSLSSGGVQAIWDALTSGLTTVGSIGKRLVDNLDTTVSSRMATFTLPTNFSSLAITVGGAVTVGTNNDKTGYSLSQSFPSNFASLNIDVSGRVLLQPTQTGVTIPTVTSVTNRVTANTDQWNGTAVTSATVRSDLINIGGVAVSTSTAQLGVNIVNAAGTAWNSGSITAGTIAADAIGASELAADAVAEIADGVWDEILSGHAISGSAGSALNAAGSAGDPWATILPGAYGAGTAGKIIGDNLNATISSRMATFTLPTNFSSLAITAGGAVTVGTNNDKTGYSLSQSFPTNFASLNIDASGRTLLQPTQTGVTIPTVTTLTNSVNVTNLTVEALTTLKTGSHNPQTGDSYGIVNNGTYGNSALNTGIANIQSRIPAALVSGRMDSYTGAMGTDVLNANALAADAVIEIYSYFHTYPVDVSVVEMSGSLISSNGGENFIQFWNNAGASSLLTVDQLSTHVTEWNDGGRLDLILDATKADTTTLLSRITSSVATLFTNLIAMITGTGASAKYTATALDNAPGGGGGGGSTTINANLLPYFVEQQNRLNQSNIKLFQNENTSVLLNISDANGPVDMTTKTLVFIVETKNKVDSVVIADGSITKGNGTVSITIGTTVTGTVGTYLWALRDITTGNTVLANGKLDVSYAPSEN